LKLRTVWLVIIVILIIDQASKIYIKTHFAVHESTPILGNWSELFFIENSGMAWGTQLLNGPIGKITLTLFRLFASIYGIYYLRKIVHKKAHKGFVLCVCLILAGAIGNLIDSMFYGLLFDKGMHWDPALKEFVDYRGQGIAQFGKGGYAGIFQGVVVDMLHFPLFTAKWPSWLPFIGGESFTFFSPIFNVADAAISVGVIAILIFQGKFFSEKKEEVHATIETNSKIDDAAQVQ
jgi:signal peptidase II